jgi:hypothetical protein
MWNIRRNATGYVVERNRVIAGTFTADSKNPGSFDLAYARALMCARNAAATN